MLRAFFIRNIGRCVHARLITETETFRYHPGKQIQKIDSHLLVSDFKFQRGVIIQPFLIFFLFFLGILLIIRGGDRFVGAAGDIAAISGIPPFVIGATIVSVATTLPEIIVSVTAAYQGQAEMATGNAIGSVTANTAMILSLPVIFIPSSIDRLRYLPKTALLIAAVILLWLTGLSGMLTPIGCMGLMLLLGVFIWENLRSAKRDRIGETAVETASLPKNILFFLLGAAAIILGSRLLVDNGTRIARDILCIDERIVSLTMVAVGTSLPELVTSVSAIIKRKASLALGNILGANIIDMLLILPLCAVIQGGTLPVSRATVWIDLPFCLFAVMILLVPALIRGRFYRVQGILSLLFYIIYMVILFTVG